MVQKGLKTTNGLGISTDDTRICIVMVGLPARGKSLIARKGKLPCFALAALFLFLPWRCPGSYCSHCNADEFLDNDRLGRGKG